MGNETLGIELAGERGDPVRVEWSLSRLAGVRAGDAAQFEVAGFDAQRWQLGRVFCGAIADGRLIAIAALRPAGARGHGEEIVAGALIRDGEAVMLDETLLSVEYGPDGEPRRVGLELYEQPDSLPLRVAGDLSGRPGPEQSRFGLRVDGVDGVGVLAVIEPA
jgi:hypothetical protein